MRAIKLFAIIALLTFGFSTLLPQGKPEAKSGAKKITLKGEVLDHKIWML